MLDKEYSIFNNPIIKREEEQIQKVDKHLRVRSIGGSEDKIYSISTMFPLKGNKRIINQLIELGWEVSLRSKVRTDGNWSRNQYEGYVMYQTMTKVFRQDINK